MAVFWVLSGCGAVERACGGGEVCEPSAAGEDGEDPPRPQRGRAQSVEASECGDDGECPADRPWCIDGGCRGCASLGGDAFCRSVGEAICTPWGRCGACDPAATYGCTDAAPHCADDFACGGCTRQSDCGDAGCDRAAAVCLEEAPVVWVDPAGCAGGPERGAAPWCSLAEALAAIGESGSATIHLAAAEPPYRPPIRRAGGAVVIEGEPGVVLAPAGDAVTLDGAARLTLTGVTIETAPSSSALVVDGGSAWLEDVQIRGGARGVVASGGMVELRRSRIEGPVREAVVAGGGAEVAMVQTVVVHAARAPGTVALDVADARVALGYCTVVDNGTAPRTTVRCDEDGTLLVRASIVGGAVSPAFDCEDLRDEESVLDHAGPLGRGSRAQAPDPSDFVDLAAGDVHLSPNAVAAWAGVARWRRGDPLSDIDGDPRVGVDLAFEHPGVDRP